MQMRAMPGSPLAEAAAKIERNRPRRHQRTYGARLKAWTAALVVVSSPTVVVASVGSVASAWPTEVVAPPVTNVVVLSVPPTHATIANPTITARGASCWRRSFPCRSPSSDPMRDA